MGAKPDIRKLQEMHLVEEDWLAKCDGDEFSSPLVNSCSKSWTLMSRSLAILRKANTGDAVYVEEEQLNSLFTVGRPGR